MSIQIAIRLPDETVEFVDSQVSTGAARSRADFIGRAIAREKRRLAAEHDLEILIAQPYTEFDDMHADIKQRGYPNLD